MLIRIKQVFQVCAFAYISKHTTVRALNTLCLLAYRYADLTDLYWWLINKKWRTT